MKYKLMIVLTAFAFFIGTAAVHAGPVEFKFAHFINPIEPGPESGQWIEKEVNEKIGDKVNAKFFHSGQMGSAIEIIKKVRMGVLQGAYLTGNYAPELNDKFGIGTLAYCMDSYEKWEALLADDALRTELFTCLKNKGLLVLDLCYFGRYGIASTKPFKTLEELRPLKMRTTQARYPLAFWNALGMNPLPMAWADVFPGLKQGVVDGTDQTVNVMRMRLTDVCQYYTHTRHMVGLFFFLVNDKWWNKLDEDTRNGLGTIISANLAKAREQSKQLTIEGDKVLKEKGIVVTELAPEEMAKFKEKEMVVWKQFEGDIGKAWLNKIKALTASIE
ncbi:TRAP transporter substrate-binding protein [Desulfosarcina ovata]|uniref:C4-dicarboxylate ABC transporter n=1 Tax=Desulfosarcina ovata subsp. ovata TaxID=2752305 RepID=A0A5K8A6S4_9BACT|nr:TRAP transporter substrate-binding protein [Desulfosarcina ovata]BBO88217.1 C4-dicarboxylate ABC transporter [Desulfosarcina ovata subsp. ovata]